MRCLSNTQFSPSFLRRKLRKFHIYLSYALLIRSIRDLFGYLDTGFVATTQRIARKVSGDRESWAANWAPEIYFLKVVDLVRVDYVEGVSGREMLIVWYLVACVASTACDLFILYLRWYLSFNILVRNFNQTHPFQMYEMNIRVFSRTFMSR